MRRIEKDESLEKRVSNEVLLYITIAYFFINVASYFHMTTMNGGGGMIYIYILPVIWLGTIIGVSLFAFIKRKILFEKSQKKTSILLLILCTPFPYLLIGKIINLLFGD